MAMSHAMSGYSDEPRHTIGKKNKICATTESFSDVREDGKYHRMIDDVDDMDLSEGPDDNLHVAAEAGGLYEASRLQMPDKGEVAQKTLTFMNALPMTPDSYHVPYSPGHSLQYTYSAEDELAVSTSMVLPRSEACAADQCLDCFGMMEFCCPNETYTSTYASVSHKLCMTDTKPQLIPDSSIRIPKPPQQLRSRYATASTVTSATFDSPNLSNNAAPVAYNTGFSKDDSTVDESADAMGGREGREEGKGQVQGEGQGQGQGKTEIEQIHLEMEISALKEHYWMYYTYQFLKTNRTVWLDRDSLPRNMQYGHDSTFDTYKKCLFELSRRGLAVPFTQLSYTLSDDERKNPFWKNSIIKEPSIFSKAVGRKDERLIVLSALEKTVKKIMDRIITDRNPEERVFPFKIFEKMMTDLVRDDVSRKLAILFMTINRKCRMTYPRTDCQVVSFVTRDLLTFIREIPSVLNDQLLKIDGDLRRLLTVKNQLKEKKQWFHLEVRRMEERKQNEEAGELQPKWKEVIGNLQENKSQLKEKHDAFESLMASLFIIDDRAKEHAMEKVRKEEEERKQASATVRFSFFGKRLAEGEVERIPFLKTWKKGKQ